MTAEEIASALELQVLAGKEQLSRDVTGGYASDLLSCVMAGAAAGDVWVTLQAHPNVIAVADLLDLACVVVTEGTQPDKETLERAEEKQIPVMLSNATTFAVVAHLAKLGVHA